MATYYGTIDGVLVRTGIQPEDLGFVTAGGGGGGGDPFGDFLIELLTQAADLMDREMRTSYLLDASIPAGLAGIAEDIVADSVRVMVQTRQTPVVRIDDFAVRTVSSMTLSKDVKERLTLYAAGAGAQSYELNQDLLRQAGPTIFVASDLVDDSLDL